MCLNLPVKIIEKKENKIIAFDGVKKFIVSDILTKAKKGDYVYLKDNLIVGKASKKEAEEIINLINSR
jgi:hydrogenase maturation factor